jgi:hypothetical protein
LPINFRIPVEVFARVFEFLDHGFDALAEFHAGQILVDLLHLRFLAFPVGLATRRAVSRHRACRRLASEATRMTAA